MGGFILLGFPENEEQVLKLKENGIEFDKVLYLTDTSEEDPGVEIKKRMAPISELYDWEWENENATKIVGLVKEQVGEEIVKDISCNGSPETVFTRIRAEIDPFFLQPDNPEYCRNNAEDAADEE